ncbi:MAG: Fur family transcriptional regulator [Solirubrobacteraceae bacterium]
MTESPNPTPASDARDLVEILHARGQRVTPQRLVILRELRRRGRHATADEIRSAIRDELPGTSTPTVYAALELLVDLGLARRLHAGAGATLYDARTEPHHHTVCSSCGRVDDLDAALDVSPLHRASADAGFSPSDVEIVVSGLCARCAGEGAA